MTCGVRPADARPRAHGRPTDRLRVCAWSLYPLFTVVAYVGQDATPNGAIVLASQQHHFVACQTDRATLVPPLLARPGQDGLLMTRAPPLPPTRCDGPHGSTARPPGLSSAAMRGRWVTGQLAPTWMRSN